MRIIFVKWMRVTVFAMPAICRNWQNTYIIYLSKGLDALEGQVPSGHAQIFLSLLVREFESSGWLALRHPVT
jgi:hypothetical protein